MTERKLVSIICPVFNEEKSLPIFYKRLKSTLSPLASRYDFELLFTNNRSTDDTLEIISALHQQDPMVQVLTLSRNFGYQASVLAGLTHVHGEAMVVVDVDCEDPPEMIPQFIAEWEKGNDIVYGIREKRIEFVVMQWMRKLYYRLLRLTADSEIILDMAEFALVSAHVRDQMINNNSTFPFLRTEVGYAGFERTGIPYTRQTRVGGKTHYNLVGMTLFGIGGFLSSSTFLLRLSAVLGTLVLPLNLAFLIGSFWRGMDQLLPTLIVLDLSYIVFFVGILSAYIARIYKNGLKRPVFIVDWKKSILQSGSNPGPAGHFRTPK